METDIFRNIDNFISILVIIFVFLVGFLIGMIVLNNNTNKIDSVHLCEPVKCVGCVTLKTNLNDCQWNLSKEFFQSQCLTSLQPTNFLSKENIIESQANDYIKIKIEDRKFYVGTITDTGSMRPALSDYSNIIYIIPEKEDLFVGDMISVNSLRSKTGRMLHRIVAINEEGYVTKGDNNIEIDKQVSKFEDINGKVIGVIY